MTSRERRRYQLPSSLATQDLRRPACAASESLEKLTVTLDQHASDPHNAQRGFWWSHVGWLYRRNPARLSRAEEHRLAADLVADPYYRFLEATALGWQGVLALGLFALGGWSWAVWGVFVRLVATYHVTWLVNSAAHLSGYRSFRVVGNDRSTNNCWVALLAWGEGWHNNHHAFPFSARHGLRWFEFDATWWTIRLLASMRLARDVKLPSRASLRRRAFVAHSEKNTA